MTRRNKYANELTTIDGIRFDSKREARRWLELQLLERAGLISELRRQVRFDLVVNQQPVCAYLADFTYQEHGAVVVEDVKSIATKRLPVYRLKKKLLKALTGVEIREV